MVRKLLIFGGTFDPIHIGHINTAICIQKHFRFDDFIFLPCKIPLLKNKALASAKDRIQMVNLALSQYPNYNFKIDEREIRRKSPSYTLITLKSYRREFGRDVSITLALGMDTFNDLHKWHNYHELLSHANILVINRPGIGDISYELRPIMGSLTEDEKIFIEHPFGKIYQFNAGSYPISSSSIRQKIQNISNKNYANKSNPLLPKIVWEYIQQNKLYRSVP